MSPSRRRRGPKRRGPRQETVDLGRYREIVDDWSAFSAAAERPEPTVLRVRRGRISDDELLARLRQQGFRVAPKDGLDGFYEVEDAAVPVSATLEHWLGLFYVQQASTGTAAPILAPTPGERVLDLCSAPGGKTTHIADLMQDSGCLVASEISESRIRGLLGNVYRLGHTNVLVTAGDGRDFPEEAVFDRVLVDAPCSGEGTLRRRGGKAPRQSRSFRGFVTGAQRELLEKAIRVTKPGGTILYVTCTFAPEENEVVVDEVLRTEPVDLVPISLDVPHAPGLTRFGERRFDERMAGAVRIYPHHFDSGGLFLAKLVKRGDAAVAGAATHAWSEVPTVFATEEEEVDEGRAAAAVEAATTDLAERYGVDGSALDGLRWMWRGGRLWLHSLSEWPLPAWSEGGWRPISVGFRAVEFDSGGRPRPTNDLLQLLGSALTSRLVDVSDDELARLFAREALPFGEDLLGPVALRWRGTVVGRAAATREGLKSEVAKARAADLARAL